MLRLPPPTPFFRRIPLVGDALVVRVLPWWSIKSFRAPSVPESLSLCVAKEKVTQEKGHPAWHFPGFLPGKSVRAGRVFRPDSCPVEKGSTSLSSPLRALSSDPHRRTGDPEQRARSCAHSSNNRPACGFPFLRHFSLFLLSRRRSRRTECGPGRARPLFGVPCTAVSRRRSGRVAGIGRKPMPFRRYMDVPPKSPAPAHGLAAQGWAASAKRGVVFSWLLLFWTSKREVTRAPKAHETLLIQESGGERGEASRVGWGAP